MSIPSSAFGDMGTATSSGTPVGIGTLSSEQMTNDLWWLNGQQSGGSPLSSPMGSVSALDLKAPGKARKEFAKGYQLLMRKDYSGAVASLTAAIAIYSDFVAAHNALGSAYMGLGQNQQAHDEFAKAAALDDHLPISFFNLGCAQIALKQFASAEASVQKAALLAPADLQLATALAYAQFMNRDYDGVLATTASVHKHKHQGAAMVHYFAAAAWDGQDNLPEAQNELRTLLQEDPKSPAADQARNLLLQFKVDQIKKDALKTQSAKPAPPPTSSESLPIETGPTPEQLAAQAQLDAQDVREQKQIAEAEAAPDTVCPACASPSSPGNHETPNLPGKGPQPASRVKGIFTVRSVVDEVAVFFAATDHGKSVTDLTREDVGIRDDQKSPAIVTAFRNQAQLPLRLGIIIDTSESVASRFSFEQHAATDFLQKVLTDKNDLAFVVGVRQLHPAGSGLHQRPGPKWSTPSISSLPPAAPRSGTPSPSPPTNSPPAPKIIPSPASSSSSATAKTTPVSIR